MHKFFKNQQFFIVGILILLMLALPVISFAAGKYPARRIQVIQPWKAGGPAHVASQLVADELTKRLGQKASVVNVQGASGVKSLMYTLGKPADGYTILDAWVSPLSTVPIIRDVKYDSYEDFIPLWGVIKNPNIIVIRRSETRFTTMKELIKFAQEHPGIKYSTGPANSINHFTIALMLKKQNVKVRNVPYPGGAASVKDLIGKVLDFSIVNPGVCKMHKSDLKPVAALADERPVLLPDVPSVKELGYWSPGPYGYVWQYYAVKKGTPKEIVNILRDTFKDIVNDEEFSKKLINMGYEPAKYPPERYNEIITNTANVAKQGYEAVQWEHSHKF